VDRTTLGYSLIALLMAVAAAGIMLRIYYGRERVLRRRRAKELADYDAVIARKAEQHHAREG
jgi:Tfp pilus assembly protein PilE